MKGKTKRLLLIWGLLTASAILVLIFHPVRKEAPSEKERKTFSKLSNGVHLSHKKIGCADDQNDFLPLGGQAPLRRSLRSLSTPQTWGTISPTPPLRYREILYTFLYRKKKVDEKIIEKEGVYRIGNVSADTKKGEIWFKGKVFKDKGWVQHLVYLEGYKWLKDESAIIAAARLIDLQRAIAILDRRLWDELWYRESQKSKVKNQKLVMSIQWNKKELSTQEVISMQDNLEIGDFIFLGSPYFDYIALGALPGADCRLCPLFALEEKALRELFVRASGQSGYELNSERMPFQGTEVTIIIRLPK